MKNEETKNKIKNMMNKIYIIIRYIIGIFIILMSLYSSGIGIILGLISGLTITPYTSKMIYNKINIKKGLKIILAIVFFLISCYFVPSDNTNIDDTKQESQIENKEKIANKNSKQKQIKKENKNISDNKVKKQTKNKTKQSNTKKKENDGSISINENNFYKYFSVKGTWYNNKADKKLNAYAIVEANSDVIKVDNAYFSIYVTCDYQQNQYPKESHTFIAKVTMKNEFKKEVYSTIGGLLDGDMKYVKNCSVDVKQASGTIKTKK